jgi:CPA2 family monovalent cation:H+ antiporter-2
VIEVSGLISDLAIILIAAAIVSLIFRSLQLPVVLGYIVTGVLIGPHMDIFPTVQDTTNIKIWAEIGVIFLLFGLGLEFSFKKLARVGLGVVFTALIQMAIMFSLGFVAGSLLGWNTINSLFLGGIVCLSSTSIVLKTVSELNLKGRRFIDNVFGVLIIEDLLTVFLLVLLSTLAISQNSFGSELIGSMLRLVFFLGLWFALGIFFIPIFLKRVRLLMNDESILVVSIGLCLFMVMIASKSGFSPALGALIMGSLLAETADGKNVERIITPIKDLFSAIFFVSIGILFDPQVLTDHWSTILFILSLVVIGKISSVTLGSVLSGQKLKSSLQAGFSLAQMGEFSLIIAALGQQLKVTSDSLYGIAVVVCALTTFTTPFMMKAALLFTDDVERFLPNRFKNNMERYQNALKARGENSGIALIMSIYGFRWIINIILIIAITLLTRSFAMQWLMNVFDKPYWAAFAASASALALTAPFFAGILFGGNRRLAQLSPEEIVRFRILRPASVVIKFFLCSVLYIIITHTLDGWVFTLQGHFFLIGIAAILIISTEGIYSRFEKQFSDHLNESDNFDINKAKKRYDALAPWDTVLESFTVSPNSEMIAKTLLEAQLKEKLGITVAVIERGSSTILAPTRNDLLLPYDKVYVIGKEEEIIKAKQYFENPYKEDRGSQEKQLGLETLLLTENSPFAFKPIRSCGIREGINGLIVGIERDQKRILNPDVTLELRPKDLLWVVGDRDLIKEFK